MKKAGAPSPSEFKHFLKIKSRWADNDMYGHVNNVVFYSWMDTVINDFLIRRACLDPVKDQVVGYCVESKCTFFSSVAFPQTVLCALRVSKMGTTSVRYEVGIFRTDEDDAGADGQTNGDENGGAMDGAPAAAVGYFVHVFVDRKSNKPVPIPSKMQDALRSLSCQ